MNQWGPLEFIPLQCGSLRWQVRRSCVNDVLRRILETPDASLTGPGLLKADPGSTVGRTHGFVVKRFMTRTLADHLQGMVRLSPALRACHKAGDLERAGIPTARPVAVADRRLLGFLVASYFVMEEIPAGTLLRERRHDKRQTIPRLAALVATLHQRGFSHRDLKEPNILLDADGQPYLIDLEGLRSGITVSDRRAARDFARLAKAALGLANVTRADQVRFLQHYLAERGRGDWRRWWRRIERAVRSRWPELAPPRPVPSTADILRAARPRLTGSRWVPLAGSRRAFVRRDWQEAFAAAGLRTASDFFGATGQPLLTPHRHKRYSARLTLNRGGSACEVYFKRYEGEGFIGHLQQCYEDGLSCPGAEREAHVATALNGAGIAAPQPLAWGWETSAGFGRRSFVVLDAAAGEPLDSWLARNPFPANPDGWRAKQRLVRQLARFVQRFHERGWCHRDCYLCHIFIAPRPNGRFALTFIDLHRVFRPRWRLDRWRIKDLAALNFSTPPTAASRTLKLRFARKYLLTDWLTPVQKRLLRRVVGKSGRISE